MIGFNGGLIGEDRTPAVLGAVGVWTLDEQVKARRTDVWPKAGVFAAGGTETEYTDGGVTYSVHTFNSDGTFIVNRSGSVDYLIIGGGSGGNTGVAGSHFGNGGAAGIAKSGSTSLTAQTYTITIGTGGAGSKQATSTAGGSSSALGFTATGGNAVSNTGRTGGSNADYSGGTNSTGNASGGGAGSAANGSTHTGGAGIESGINGTIRLWGGGGAGITTANQGVAQNSSGGGSSSSTGNGGNGEANTGSGGGGGSPDSVAFSGGNGANGVVIIRYNITN